MKLSIPVLLRLARRDVGPADADLILPFEHGPAGQLCSIVGDTWLRRAVEPDHGVEHARDPAALEPAKRSTAYRVCE
ncbi:hypothetical protein EON80_20175 [bacterium]|nr:MAG: hypothetical protein EON80_20175 [bacterium]